jgi:hypothetical protein
MTNVLDDDDEREPYEPEAIEPEPEGVTAARQAKLVTSLTDLVLSDGGAP